MTKLLAFGASLKGIFIMASIAFVRGDMLPVILISGRDGFARAEYEAKRGDRRLFEKPFDRQELLAAIASELDPSTGRP